MSIIEEIQKKYNFDDSYLRFLRYNIKAYRKVCIKKKDGTDRCLMIPCKNLKLIQKEALVYIKNKNINNRYLEKQYAYSKGKNNISYASIHLERKHIFKYDLKDYFDQITFPRVLGTLKKHNFSEEEAVFISQLACYRINNSHVALAQGSPLSPFLSNIVSTPVDGFFIKYVDRHNDVKYSRYADDITLSTDSAETAKIIDKDYEFIKTCLLDRHFELNDVKYKHLYKGKKIVGGIKVNTKLNVNKKLIDEIKLNLFYAKNNYEKTRDEYNNKYKCKNKVEDKNKYYRESIIGKINYVSLVKGDDDFVVKRLKEKFNSIDEFNYKFDLRESMEKSIFVLEFNIINEKTKDECPYTGTAFITKYGLFTCYHNFFSFNKESNEYYDNHCIVLKNKTNTINKYQIIINTKELTDAKKKCDVIYNNFFEKEYDIAFISNDYLKQHMLKYDEFVENSKTLELYEEQEIYRNDFSDNISIYGYSQYNDNRVTLHKLFSVAKYDKYYYKYYVQDSLGEGASGSPIIYKNKVIGIYTKGVFGSEHSEGISIFPVLDRIKK